MSGINDRKRGEEAKYALDQQTEMKVMARRNKLLGLWAAELMGISGNAAADYARAVVISDLEEAGEEDVFRKVRADLDEARVERSDEQVRTQMAELLPIAREQVIEEAAKG